MSCPQCGPGGGPGERNPNARWSDAQMEELHRLLARETRIGPAQVRAYTLRYAMSVWHFQAIRKGYRRPRKVA